MSNPYVDYYVNQAGSGLAAFEGYQYQRGHGFFGSLFQNIIKPLGRYLGRQALSTGLNVGNDLLQGANLKDSLVKNAKITSKNVLGDAITRAQKFAQTGSGKRRKRKRKTKLMNPKPKKSNKKKKSKKKRTVKKRRSKVKHSKFLHLF